jgi:hypothetical protein
LDIPQLLISMLLFIVLFFGIGFILNMLLRATWIMAMIYPIIVIFIVDDASVRFYDYFTKPAATFSSLGNKITQLTLLDTLILSMGLLGSILAGIAILLLRKKGYRMF